MLKYRIIEGLTSAFGLLDRLAFGDFRTLRSFSEVHSAVRAGAAKMDCDAAARLHISGSANDPTNLHRQTPVNEGHMAHQSG